MSVRNASARATKSIYVPVPSQLDLEPLSISDPETEQPLRRRNEPTVSSSTNPRSTEATSATRSLASVPEAAIDPVQRSRSGVDTSEPRHLDRLGPELLRRGIARPPGRSHPQRRPRMGQVQSSSSTHTLPRRAGYASCVESSRTFAGRTPRPNRHAKPGATSTASRRLRITTGRLTAPPGRAPFMKSGRLREASLRRSPDARQVVSRYDTPSAGGH